MVLGDWFGGPLPRHISDYVGEKLLDILTRIGRADPNNVLGYDNNEEDVTEAFLEMFSYHARFPILFGWYLFFVFLADLGMGRTNIQLYGLIIDGVGAVLLAVGLFRGRVAIVRDTSETGGRWVRSGGSSLNKEELRANASNTIDGVFGATFLIIGFSIQIISLLLDSHLFHQVSSWIFGRSMLF